MRNIFVLLLLLLCSWANAANVLQLNYKLSVKDDLQLTWKSKVDTTNTAKVSDLSYKIDYSLPIQGATKLVYGMDGTDTTKNLKFGIGFQNDNTKASFAFSQKLSTDVTKPAEGVLMTLEIESRF